MSSSVLVEEIMEDVGRDELSGMHKKTITHFQMQSVILKDMPNLKNYIGANYECQMLALTKVKVDNCGLSTLFMFSVFRQLQQLEDLEVSNCKLLEGIVDYVRDDETSFANDKISQFQLSFHVLRHLPNLKSFSRTSSYAFNIAKIKLFPSAWVSPDKIFHSLKNKRTTGICIY